MNTSLGVGSQVAASRLFLDEVGNGRGSGQIALHDHDDREHMSDSTLSKMLNIFKPGSIYRENLNESSRDPRFLPYNALVHYQVGSDTVDIDRVYGTVAQKTRYPKYTDMIKYGITSIPDKSTEDFVSFTGDQFYDSTSRGSG
jgi:hypothetical protein